MAEYLSIKKWAEEDRPREKMLQKGKEALSDAELLAILIGSGNKEESAVDLAKRILMHTENNISILAKLDMTELMKFKGIGEAKAITIAAALELGRRRREQPDKEIPAITSSKDAFQLLYAVFADKHYEEFWILILNRANKVIKKVQISEGGGAQTVVDVKKIFKAAVDYRAHSIICAHNHPSESIVASKQDIKLTRQIKDAGNLLQIPLLDHIIFGGDKYYSFADEGAL